MSAYAGDVSVNDCWNALSEDERAILVDVRTSAEWGFVGVCDLSQLGKQPVLESWVLFPDMSPNMQFVDKLEGLGLDKDTPIYFLCRSGVRSQGAAAAMTQAGYTQCFNILAGFEGDVDEQGHRGSLSGWKVAGLPWVQR